MREYYVEQTCGECKEYSCRSCPIAINKEDAHTINVWYPGLVDAIKNDEFSKAYDIIRLKHKQKRLNFFVNITFSLGIVFWFFIKGYHVDINSFTSLLGLLILAPAVLCLFASLPTYFICNVRYGCRYADRYFKLSLGLKLLFWIVIVLLALIFGFLVSLIARESPY